MDHHSTRNNIRKNDTGLTGTMHYDIFRSINGLQSSSNIQFLETDDGKFVTQSYDIANLLAEYKENSINKNNSSSYPTNYDTYIY